MNTKKNKLEYDQYVAFINRETELNRLRKFVNKEPSEMLFLHGPKSSGKTTLLYKFFDQIQKEQKMDVKFLNLREKLIGTKEDAEKIWDTVGGSMWEIQNILGHLFDKPIDEVLAIHKKKMKGIISYYIGADDKKEKILGLFLKTDQATVRDFVDLGIGKEEAAELLRHMVRNNILYFDPIEAVYYPQARSFQWGIRLYFESIGLNKKKKKQKRK